MKSRVLIDTDVAIDYLRGQAAARDVLEREPRPIVLSALSVAELFAGVREGAERPRLEAFVRAFDVVPVTLADAEQGGLHRRAYGKSHNTGLVDALLAAQAQRLDAELVTLNAKHYPMLTGDGLRVPYVKP